MSTAMRMRTRQSSRLGQWLRSPPVTSLARRVARRYGPVALQRAQGIMSSAARRMAATAGSGRALRGSAPGGSGRRGAIPHGRVVNEGTGGQCSYFRGPKGTSYLPKHVEDALPPQIEQFNGASQIKSAVGQQAIVTPLNIFTPTTILDYTGDKISRVLCKEASGSVTLNNIYLSNCYVIIYDIFARKDAGVSTIATPALAWAQGVSDESSTGNYQYLGATPWQSELFNQYYRVAQVTNVVLGAGGTHVHNIRLKPERVISAAYAEYSTFCLKDLTYFCMIEIHGSPANDTSVQTQVSVGVGGLNIIGDSEQTMKQLQKATPTITLNNTLLSSFTNGEQVVNLGGSTIVPQAEG